MTEPTYVRFFEEFGIEDVPLVGGKNASLGEMYQKLSARGRARAERLRHHRRGLPLRARAGRACSTRCTPRSTAWSRAMSRTSPDAQSAPARSSTAPASHPTLAAEILDGYRRLQAEYGEDVSLAVRSSATAEDLPTASFAGQQDTFLNIRGEESLLDACRRCFASLFTDRSIHYRIDQGFDHFKVALSIGVMKMVRSDLASSGVMFSLDTESGFRDVVFLTGAYGLGENVVQGAVDPDEFYVHKPTLAAGHRAVLRRLLGDKAVKMVFVEGETKHTTRNVPTPKADRDRFCLTDADVLELADSAVRIENALRAPDGHGVGEGRPRRQALHRPGSTRDGGIPARGDEHRELRPRGKRGEVLAEGRSGRREDRLGDGAGDRERRTPRAVPAGRGARRRYDDAGLGAGHEDRRRDRHQPRRPHLPRGDHRPGARRSRCGRSGRRDDRRARAATMVTVSCAEGDTGRVYRGEVGFHVDRSDVADLARPTTKIMINLGNPDLAFKTSFLPNDGVGLARMEFIISESIRAHPLALLHPERVSDLADRAAVEQLIRHYPDGEHFFVERLSEGIGTIAAAFWPKPVVVRMSDFKTNEYASLLGGADFEPAEDNPMLGFRGASRYAHPAYAEGFALECTAMKRVREEMGLTNVVLMLPFVRRVAEAEQVLARMAELGLRRGENGLEVYAMCEIPNNVILIDRFAEYFDGFSIGSNDLTQLTLGVDRDSEIVAFDYDERDEGVKEMIRLAVEGCRRQPDPLGAVRAGAVGLPRHGGVPRRARHRLDEPQPRHRAQDHPVGRRRRGEARRLKLTLSSCHEAARRFSTMVRCRQDGAHRGGGDTAWCSSSAGC